MKWGSRGTTKKKQTYAKDNHFPEEDMSRGIELPVLWAVKRTSWWTARYLENVWEVGTAQLEGAETRY